MPTTAPEHDHPDTYPCTRTCPAHPAFFYRCAPKADTIERVADALKESGPGVDTPYGQADDAAHGLIEGLSPDQPIVRNEHGGGQSATPYRLDLVDAKSLFAMAKVLAYGAERYGAGNWRLIPLADHLNHLIAHAYAVLAGDTSDEHLSHIMCRAMFADAVARDGVGRNSQQARDEMPTGPVEFANEQKIYNGLLDRGFAQGQAMRIAAEIREILWPDTTNS